MILTDGGVYDNLGLETAWKRHQTVLVSDAGGKTQAEAEPKADWARHSYRILNLVDNQVRALRKRQVIESFKSGARKGAYWGIRTNIKDYQLSNPLDCPFERTLALAETPTDLSEWTTTCRNDLSTGAMPSAMPRCESMSIQRCSRRRSFPIQRQ